jgi:hypothetical protein
MPLKSFKDFSNIVLSFNNKSHENYDSFKNSHSMKLNLNIVTVIEF